MAAKCYGMFDISFLGIDSINSVSSSRQTNVVFTSNSTYHEWYDDSCATNHVTIDEQSEYQGKLHGQRKAYGW